MSDSTLPSVPTIVRVLWVAALTAVMNAFGKKAGSSVSFAEPWPDPTRSVPLLRGSAAFALVHSPSAAGNGSPAAKAMDMKSRRL